MSVVSFQPAMRTILVVDDQPSVLAALAFVFTSNGYAVLLAGKGNEALAMAESQTFEVALVDLHMPVMDGIAVCRALCDRCRVQGRNVPVWVMTAAHTKEAAAKAIEAGARALLKKPFDSLELMKEIDVLLASPPLRSENAGEALASTQAVA